ncbi:hypothetical protein [Desulfosudis oleivorans]|uniref:Uncharacterized protein n=1 Tax=Desulfosudis oleivorans (strain DSM 6200 / JCM 39069 / Hxd3) TaxID=96561 RepID=A8ZY44_DESOH|nr:hypothetical protein [Desulfosudis oleivorans]ABW67051.1 hypothetical protein Dole_1245 [Desulfosudis oleivorans Hxd3]
MTTENRQPLWGLVWGIMLLLMGCGVFYRTHQLIPRIEEIAGAPATALFIRICLYIMGILLAGGGIKKIRHYYSRPRADQTDPAP